MRDYWAWTFTAFIAFRQSRIHLETIYPFIFIPTCAHKDVLCDAVIVVLQTGVEVLDMADFFFLLDFFSFLWK